MTDAGLLVGSQVHPADGDARRRQERAVAELRRVCRWPLINLQFRAGEPFEADGLETQPVLVEDSNRATGRSGRRKPLVNEMFTRLAELASARGLRYFVFTNSDILFTAEAFDRILTGDHRAFLFSRTDVDPDSGRDLQPLIYGADVFAVEARWWLTHHTRFRPYVVGENAWDNVYAAQILCWSGGTILNREPLVRHEAHPIVWPGSPFADHNAYLAGLDRMYFSRWVHYVRRLEALRAKAGGLAPFDEELGLQEEAFRGWQPGLADRALQALRVAKMRLRRRRPSPST